MSLLLLLIIIVFYKLMVGEIGGRKRFLRLNLLGFLVSFLHIKYQLIKKYGISQLFKISFLG